MKALGAQARALHLTAHQKDVRRTTLRADAAQHPETRCTQQVSTTGIACALRAMVTHRWPRKDPPTTEQR
jgi:hypothetical protein